MKDYELTVVFHPDLEMNLDPALDKVKKIVETAGGKITKEENESKKRLAYKIKNQDFALYYFFNVSLPSDAPEKISSALNIADEVLRYLLVRTDEKKAKIEAQREIEESADRTEEASDDAADEDNKTNKEKGE